MLQTEMVGKVSMDYRYYTGVDLYSDGAVEDELLDIVINHKPSEYGDIIEQRVSWPIFYHLSEQRGNIIEWIPMAKGARVLEVGSGCGAITSALAKKEVSIDCVELSKKRSLINANRNREQDDITIHVGNFRDIEPGLPTDFDYILLIGVLEYAQQYIGGEHPFETFIYMLMRHLAPGGRIIIAIENRLGMKYFAGCKEDHASRYFAGQEGYQRDDPARTFSREALMRIIRSAGVQDFHFYYPYPDYKFTSMIHSDQYMPREGEFLDNVHNYDQDRMVLFNEKYAFESLARDRIYQDFANSFEVVIGPPLPQVYIKYSNDRDDAFKIRTDIALDQLGRLQIRKHPLTVLAREHVRNMSSAYEALTDRYRGGDIAVNDCQLDGRDDSAIFSFVTGVTLASLMDACVARGDLAGFNSLFQEYLRRISYREDYPVADYDLIFSNILVNGPVWTIIDYEWTYGKKIPTREIAFRALYSYMLEDKRRRIVDFSKYYTALGLDNAQTDALLREEAGFQKYVTGGRKSMVELWKMLGYKSEVPASLKGDTEQGPDRVQIYTNRGRGFNETDSYFPEARYDDNHQINLNIRFDDGTNSVRVDPAFADCVVTIKRIVWNEKMIDDESLMSVHPNGAWLSDDSLVFNTADPYIEFIPSPSGMKGRHGNVLSLTLSTVIIPHDVADNLYSYQVDMPEEEEATYEEPQTMQPEPLPVFMPQEQPVAQVRTAAPEAELFPVGDRREVQPETREQEQTGKKETVSVSTGSDTDFYARVNRTSSQKPQPEIAPLSDEEIEIFDFGKDKIVANPLPEKKTQGKRASERTRERDVYLYDRDTYYEDDDEEGYEEEDYEEDYEEEYEGYEEDDLYDDDDSYEDEEDDFADDSYDEDEGFDAFEDYDEDRSSSGRGFFAKRPDTHTSTRDRRQNMQSDDEYDKGNSTRRQKRRR